MKDVFSLFTSDLVSLSYSNDLREFGTTKTWYLRVLAKAYKDVDIQFLPNNIIQELNQKSDSS
jgi:hypothetical protein